MKKIWHLKKAEKLNDGYDFSGKIYVTKRIKEELSSSEIQSILDMIWNRVIKEFGLDYHQIYYDETGQVIFVIDNINKMMRYTKPRKWVEENDYLTIMFADEY